MNTNAIFGLSALAFFISSVVVAWLFAWPWLRTVNLRLALLCLDVYGAGFDAPGRGKLDNEKHSIEFRWDSKEGALTNKFTFDSQAKTWTSLIRQVEKGEWKTFAEEKWTRK